MKIISFLLFIPHLLSGKLFTKIIYTPVYDSMNICNAHHVVLLKTTPFEDNQIEYKELYAVDFSPDEDITKLDVALYIFLGKKIKGKIQVFFVDKCDSSTAAQTILDNPHYMLTTLDSIKDIDIATYNRIQDWDPLFQLYNHNCQHFARHISL